MRHEPAHADDAADYGKAGGRPRIVQAHGERTRRSQEVGPLQIFLSCSVGGGSANLVVSVTDHELEPNRTSMAATHERAPDPARSTRSAAWGGWSPNEALW